MPGFFFSSFFVTLLKIGSFRLPTHRRDAHRNFFLMIPSFNQLPNNTKKSETGSEVSVRLFVYLVHAIHKEITVELYSFATVRRFNFSLFSQ